MVSLKLGEHSPASRHLYTFSQSLHLRILAPIHIYIGYILFLTTKLYIVQVAKYYGNLM